MSEDAALRRRIVDTVERTRALGEERHGLDAVVAGLRSDVAVLERKLEDARSSCAALQAELDKRAARTAELEDRLAEGRRTATRLAEARWAAEHRVSKLSKLAMELKHEVVVERARLERTRAERTELRRTMHRLDTKLEVGGLVRGVK